ncbi:hypothetical protein ACFOVU_11755 [Nocardiopsis sediminis]|uniref:DUF1097 domain-containing protein n=1 Tax=Nocardiopsis sediminis TaxID=1778267 RepID=A0ABV8FMP4_9ACTN
MTPRRRMIVSLAALVPAALIAAAGVLFGGGFVLLAEVIGAVAAVALFGVAVHLLLPGLDARRAGGVVLVLCWGGFVLATAAGEAVGSVAAGQMGRADFGWSGSSSSGYFAYAPLDEGEDDVFTSQLGPEDPLVSQSTAVAVGPAPFPGGAVVGGLLTGWITGVSALVAYVRTRAAGPEAGGSGAESGV